jgi:hypothetical protein
MVEREGFEPSKLTQRIYSPPHLATLVSLHFSKRLALYVNQSFAATRDILSRAPTLDNSRSDTK